MSDVGVAFVQIVPSAKGFSGNITKELADPLTKAAKKAGDDAGKEMSKGIAKGVDGGGGRFRSSADKVVDIFKGAMAAGGLAAGALLVEGLQGAMENEVATDRLAAQLGGGQFGADMGRLAGEIYVDAFGDSVADVGDALKGVWQAGLIPEDAADADIKRVTEKLLTFTDVMQQDVDMATQAVSNMIRTGIADSSEDAFDILTRGIQQGVDRGGDLLETFQEYSTQFRELGLDAETATGLMMQGLQGGARDADTVADALKELAIRGKDMSESTVDAFDQMGLSSDEMTAMFAAGGEEAFAATNMVIDGFQELETQAERDAVAVALFGTKAEDLQDALFALDPETAAAGLGNVEGATDKLGSAYDNAATRIEAFKRGALMRLTNFVGGTVIPFIERLAAVLGPPITAAVAAVRDAIDRIDFDPLLAMWSVFTEALSDDVSFGFSGHLGVIQDIGTTLNSVYNDAIKPLFDYLNENRDLVVGALTAIGVVIAAIVVPALVSMAASMIAAAAPFILIGLAAAAVGAGLVWLYNNVASFRDFVQEALPLVAGIFQSAFELIKAVVRIAVTVISFLWENFGQYLISVITIAWDLISGVVLGALNVIQGIIRLVTAIITGDWSGAWDAIKQIVAGAWQIITTVISAALQLVWQLIQIAWQAIVLIIRGALTLAWNLIKAGFSLIKSIIVGILRAVVNDVRSKFNTVVGFFRALPGRVRSAFSTLARTITSPFRSAFGALKRLWNNTVGGFSFSVPDWIPGVVGGKGFSIPSMQVGGVFRAGGGGAGLALLHDQEVVLNPEQQAAAASAITTPAAAEAVVRFDFTGADQEFARMFRRMVHVEGGGNVQVAFGR